MLVGGEMRELWSNWILNKASFISVIIKRISAWMSEIYNELQLGGQKHHHDVLRVRVPYEPGRCGYTLTPGMSCVYLQQKALEHPS